MEIIQCMRDLGWTRNGVILLKVCQSCCMRGLSVLRMRNHICGNESESGYNCDHGTVVHSWFVNDY